MPRGRIADIRYRVIPVTDPAAGASATVRNGGQFTQVLRSAAFQVVTGAAVADRSIELSLSDGSDTYWRSAAIATQAASSTVRYSAFPGAAVNLAAGRTVLVPLDAYGQVIRPGHGLTVTAFNLQAADQISDITLSVLEMETGWVAAAMPVVPLYVAEFDPTYA